MQSQNRSTYETFVSYYFLTLQFLIDYPIALTCISGFVNFLCAIDFLSVHFKLFITFVNFAIISKVSYKLYSIKYYYVAGTYYKFVKTFISLFCMMFDVYIVSRINFYLMIFNLFGLIALIAYHIDKYLLRPIDKLSSGIDKAIAIKNWINSYYEVIHINDEDIKWYIEQYKESKVTLKTIMNIMIKYHEFNVELTSYLGRFFNSYYCDKFHEGFVTIGAGEELQPEDVSVDDFVDMNDHIDEIVNDFHIVDDEVDEVHNDEQPIVNINLDDIIIDDYDNKKRQ